VRFACLGNTFHFDIVAVCGVAAVVLASCAPAPAAQRQVATTVTEAPVTIRLESYNYGSPGLGGKALQTMIDEFQALYPAIKIEGKNTAPTPDGQMKMIVTEQAAGDPPDIAQLGLNSVDYAIRELGAQPIDQFAAKDEYDALMTHLLPSARPLGMRNGHLYASPFTFSTPTLFYNADIFRAAGLDPNTPPTTWDEVHRYGLQIKARTDKAPLDIGAIGSTGDWLAQSLVSSNGGSLLSTDGTRATFNQPPAVATFTWFQGLVADGTNPPLSSNDAIAAFNSGNLAMFLNSTALLYGAEAAASGKFELRTASEPAFGSQPVHPVNSGSGLYVFSKDPARQRAAWQFLRFGASQRGFTIITSMIGYVPQRDDVVDDPRYLKPFVDKDPNLLTAFKQLPSLEPWLNWSKAKQGVQAESLFVDALQNVVYGGQAAQQTMDAAADRVTTLLSGG
jgi:sn-glycerol 3-phosphate transport system substrate-binding protein